MDYDTARSNAIRNACSVTVQDFVRTYRRGRPTLVVLPGGMGSQLDRSAGPYDGGPPNFPDFDPVWLDVGLLFDADALKLEIDTQGRDRDAHIIVANGPLRFLVKAYDGTERWAAASGFNYVVFGYDWRRPIEEGAGYLELFLTLLRDKVFQRHGENPLPRTTLLAHSQGGLVAKVFLHRIFDVPSWMERLVTVGTPFYGTWSHADRYYAGQEPLNALHGKGTIARVIGTLPGPYALMFIDQATYARDWRQLGFASANDYPVTDAASGAPVDFYDAANLGRYPPWIRRDDLERARLIRQTIAAPLPAAVAQCVFNVRSACDKATPVRQVWSSIGPGFDPDNGDASPVTSLADVRTGGDNTVPAWSAWHASVPAANRHELAHAADHTYLLEHEEVLNLVGALVAPGYQPVQGDPQSGVYGRSAARTSSADIRRFAGDVADHRASRSDPRAYDERTWRGIIEDMKR